MCRDRGFTLIEVLIAVGLVVLVAAGAVGATLSSRSMAVTTAAGGFDSLLDAARTTARQFPDGATIAFTTDAYGDGIIARLYQNRPNTAPLIASTIPAVEARVGLSESETSSKPPFAIAIDVGGAISLIPGNIFNGSTSATPCPASGKYHLTFAYAGFQAVRDIPCRITLANTGTPTLLTVTTASPQASPTITACLGSSCVVIPTPPSPSATCPPGYVASAPGTCVPAPSATPTPTATPQSISLKPAQFVCDSHNPPAPYGTDLGADADGVHEDFSNQTWCGGPSPSPSPTPVRQIVEIQQWTAYNGTQQVAVAVDFDYFVLWSDWSATLGAPAYGTQWTCSAPVNVNTPGGGAVWGGFFIATASQGGFTGLYARYQDLYQRANDTGGDGWLSVTMDLACS